LKGFAIALDCPGDKEFLRLTVLQYTQDFALQVATQRLQFWSKKNN
jgi:hypothetical protein